MLDKEKNYKQGYANFCDYSMQIINIGHHIHVRAYERLCSVNWQLLYGCFYFT